MAVDASRRGYAGREIDPVAGLRQAWHLDQAADSPEGEIGEENETDDHGE